MLGYTVYRTTNKLNGMFYIGVHKTKNPNDDYLGSGKRLKYAIKKYGIENFVKEVLYSFENKEEAFSKEKELVTEEVLDSGKCYNLKLGGDGGWDFANSIMSSDDRRINGSKGGKSLSNRLANDQILRQLFQNRMKEINKIQNSTGLNPFLLSKNRFDSTGYIHNELSKNKMKLHGRGTGNSQFGSKWITDGILNKKIKKDQEIPEGWRSGRVC